MKLSGDDRDDPRAEAFRAFIKNPPFPCVGAKSALSRGHMKILIARDITSGWDDCNIYPELLGFVARYKDKPDLFQSFAVVFGGPDNLSEEQFESALWHRAQSLADKDACLGQPYDERVASDPDNPHFSLSFGGEAFFVVGLHPNASRPARRFDLPVLVFNLHAQFEQLRAEGRYEKMRATILQRDEDVTGTVNPMLARHGENSEARQYSGRMVDADWRCPFQPRSPMPMAPASHHNPVPSLDDLQPTQGEQAGLNGRQDVLATSECARGPGRPSSIGDEKQSIFRGLISTQQDD